MRQLLILALLWAIPATADPVNVWLAMRDDGQQAIVTRLQCDLSTDCTYVAGLSRGQCDVRHTAYLDWLAERLAWSEAVRAGQTTAPFTIPNSGDCTASGVVTNRQAKVFALMADRDNVQRLFRVDTVTGRQWTLWSVYFDAPVAPLLMMQMELDNLAANYTSQFVVIGAWHWDGRQVGTQWELDADEQRTGDTIGISTYPIHARLIQFMPDIVTYDEDGNETSRTRPITMSDVNLGFGQSPRRFQ